MLELVNQYKEAAQLIEAAQAEQELIKAQIKAELAARGTDTLQVGCHKVKLSDFTSTRLDSKAITGLIKFPWRTLLVMTLQPLTVTMPTLSMTGGYRQQTQ